MELLFGIRAFLGGLFVYWIKFAKHIDIFGYDNSRYCDSIKRRKDKEYIRTLRRKSVSHPPFFDMSASGISRTDMNP